MIGSRIVAGGKVKSYHLIAYPLFLIAALEFILGIVLLRNNPRRSNVQRAVALISFFSAAFSFTTATMYVRASLGLPIDFAARFNWIGWFTVPTALQILYYLKDEQSRAGHVVGLILHPLWLVVLGLCLFTDLIVTPGYSVIPFINHPGPLENPARLFGASLAVWLLYKTIRIKKELHGIRKAQLNYFFQGVLIFGGGAAFTAGVLQVLGGFGFEPGLASFFSLPWVLLTYYAITRHRLFDIRLILARAFAVILLVALFAVIQIGLFKLFTPALGEALSILASLSVIGIIFSATRINRRVQRLAQVVIVQDKYDYQDVLKESIKAITTILALEELLDYIVRSIKKSLGVDSVYLVLQEKNGRFVRTDGTLYPAPNLDTGVNSTLAAWVLAARQAVVREEIETDPAEEGGPISDAMKKMGAALIIPLLYKGDLKGFIVLGEKGSRDPYLQSDIDLLQSLAGHAAIAIENAQLYEEARRAKGFMRESEAKFQTLAETAAMAIFIHQGGNFLYANRAGEVIGGYSVDEYLTMNFMSLVHPDFVDLVKNRARQRLSGSGEVPSQYEFKILRKNKEVRWVLMTGGISEFDGKPAVIGTLIDITERKQAEEEREEYHRQLQDALQSLKESELRFRTLAETTTAAIFIHQGQNLVYANPAGVTMTGYSSEELLRENFWSFVHPDYQEMVKHRGQARLRGENPPRDYEYKFIKKNGEECWVSMTAGHIEYGGKPAIIATLFDITGWKRAEEAKIQFYEESVRQYQERIEEEKRHRIEKEKILMDLHDGIGGITTNISILSELALKAPDQEQRAQTLSTIAGLSREGIAEIRNFMHSLDSKELNWRTLAAELRSQGTNMVEPHQIRFSLETDIGETTDQPGSLLWVSLFKIYKEVLTNVIKHSSATAVFVMFRVHPNGIFLSIQDNGVGMKAEACGGRGLSNIKTRARDIGGNVTVSCAQGTAVSVELPLPLQYPVEGMVK